MHSDVQEVLITEEQLQERIQALGKQIGEDYAHSKQLLLLCVLKGSVVFLADLMRAIPLPVQIEFLAVSSYGHGAKSSGVVKIVKDLDVPLQGLDVLIVEDILDSGKTLFYLSKILRDRSPHSLRIVTLLDKPDCRVTDIQPDYVGFIVPDEFIVGYGLDYGEKYRNLPYIGTLRREIYEP